MNTNRNRAAEIIRTRREELELSQCEVAERVRNRRVTSLSEPHYRRIEKGLALPTVVIALEIASVLDLDIYEIWG